MSRGSYLFTNLIGQNYNSNIIQVRKVVTKMKCDKIKTQAIYVYSNFALYLLKTLDIMYKTACVIKITNCKTFMHCTIWCYV